MRSRPLSGTMIISEVGTSGPPPPAPGIPPGIAAPGPFSDDIIMSNLIMGSTRIQLSNLGEMLFNILGRLELKYSGVRSLGDLVTLSMTSPLISSKTHRILQAYLFLESGPSPSRPMGRFSDGGGPPSDGPGFILDAICKE